MTITTHNTSDVYLSQLVALKKALHQLNAPPQISLCDNDLKIQVYQGIGLLAVAARQPLAVTPRNCRDFPLALHFVYEGVSFCELKSAAVARVWGCDDQAEPQRL